MHAFLHLRIWLDQNRRHHRRNRCLNTWVSVHASPVNVFRNLFRLLGASSSYKKIQRHYVYCWFVLESANQCYICVNVVQRAFVYIVNAPVYPWSDTCSWPLTPTSSTPVAARHWCEAAALTSLKRRPAAIAHCLFCRATSANSRWPDWLTHRPIVSSIHTASAKRNTQRTRHTCAKGVPQERRWSGVQRQIFGIPMPIVCMHTVRAICKSLSSRDELSFSRDQ